MSKWKEYKLGEILSLITKGTTPPKGVGFVQKGINYIKSDAIGYDRKLDKTKIVFIDNETHQKFKRSQLVENDILFSMAGIYLGKNAIVLKDVLPANTNQALAILRLNKEKANPNYVSLFLSQPNIIDFINNMSGQSAQPNINFEEIKSIEILLPPLPEQTAIASILSSLDDKIDLLHRQNTTLEKMAETLFRQWFVEEADESWETVKVGDFVKTNIRTVTKEYPFQEIEYLDTSSLTKGVIAETQKLSLNNSPSRAKRLVQNNDILISTVRPDQNHHGIIINPKENLVVSTGFCVITCAEINPYFIYLLLTNNEMTQYLHSIAEGSTSTYPSLKPSDIEKIEFTKPPTSLIIEFGNLVENYWIKINKNQIQIRTLTSMRDNLLPKLMSGEVRVKI